MDVVVDSVSVATSFKDTLEDYGYGTGKFEPHSTVGYSQGYKETQCNKAKFLLLIVFIAWSISLLLDIPVDIITGLFNCPTFFKSFVFTLSKLAILYIGQFISFKKSAADLEKGVEI